MVRGEVLAGVRAVGVAVALEHPALHVGRLVLGQGGLAPRSIGRRDEIAVGNNTNKKRKGNEKLLRVNEAIFQCFDS